MLPSFPRRDGAPGFREGRRREFEAGRKLVVHRETDDTGEEGITTWPNAVIPYM